MSAQVAREIGNRVVSSKIAPGELIEDEVALSARYQIRQTFEPKAAHWTADRGSALSYVDFNVAVERMETEPGPIEDFIFADATFHRAILRSTENEFLLALEGIIFSALLSSIRLTNDNLRKNEKSPTFHRGVYEAIAAGDGDRAELVMEAC